MPEASDERRRAPRHAVELPAILVTSERLIARGVILDINQYGCRIQAPDFEAPERFYVIDVAGSTAYDARAMWRQPPLVGTRFMTTWDLAAADAPQWLADIRTGVVRAEAAERGIRVVWSAP